MLVEDFLPVYDVSDAVATVVEADLAITWDALMEVDLIDVGRRRPLAGLLGAMRILPDIVGHMLHGELPQPAPAHLCLRDTVTLPMGEGGWVLLGERPQDEIALGLVGKFWRPVIEFANASADRFREFDEPGFAKTIYSLSVRPLHDAQRRDSDPTADRAIARTLLTGIMRTATTDAHARRWFNRYWTFGIGSGAHVLVNGLLDVTREIAEARTSAPHPRSPTSDLRPLAADSQAATEHSQAAARCSMHAFRLTAPQTTDFTTVPQPEPKPGEVLVRVGAAGVCHSDLHIIDDPHALGMPLPLTLGHENAGWIEALGAGVSGFEKGEAVAVYGIVGCGTCVACLAGRDNECRRTAAGGIGLSRDGGMAEYVVVPARQLIPIGDLDVAQAAPLTDAGLTPYHAIELSRHNLRPSSTVVVIGVGGLGHMAVQILSVTTASRIIAVDLRDEALALAREVGAHEAFKSDDTAVANIRALVGPPPGGADVVLDFVGAAPTLEIARSVVSTGGDLVIVGLAGGTLPVGFGTMPFEARVTVPFWGTRAELAEVIALARAGRIRAHVEKFPLSDVRKAYDALRAGRLSGRAVVVPG
jgi:propanol-preferring alcohol dehydrogenase